MRSVLDSCLRKAPLFALTVFAFSVAGCKGEDAGSGLEEISEEIFPSSADVTVSITNTDGSIRVYGADTNEIKIQIIKKAFSEERLKQIVAHITNDRSRFSVTTTYPPRPEGLSLRDRSGTVDYNVVVPQTCALAKIELANGEVLVDGMRGAPVNASLVNGRIAGKNCFAETHFKVVNGGLDLFYDWWEKRRFSLVVEADNANLRASIPSDASFRFQASTQTGNIADGFAEKSERNRGGIRSVDVTIGSDPETEIQMRTTSGNVRLDQAY